MKSSPRGRRHRLGRDDDVLGLLPVKEAAGVLSNAAPWTIAFMFLIMGGLLRTGALEMMSRAVSSRITTSRC